MTLLACYKFVAWFVNNRHCLCIMRDHFNRQTLRLSLFILIAFLALAACRSTTNKTSPVTATPDLETKKDASSQNSASTNSAFLGYGLLWTRAIYQTVESNGVIIENTFPKGGPYTDPNGRNFGYGVFCSRVINKTATPIDLTISFPADLFAIPPSPDFYLKVFLPSDTMTLDKVLLYDYGATGLKSFMDTSLHTPTMLQRTISPNEDFVFYIGTLFGQEYGPVRAGLVLKDQELFYKLIGIAPELDDALIPCGQIVPRKLNDNSR
jgi:hypothetical protein